MARQITSSLVFACSIFALAACGGSTEDDPQPAACVDIL